MGREAGGTYLVRQLKVCGINKTEMNIRVAMFSGGCVIRLTVMKNTWVFFVLLFCVRY